MCMRVCIYIISSIYICTHTHAYTHAYTLSCSLSCSCSLSPSPLSRSLSLLNKSIDSRGIPTPNSTCWRRHASRNTTCHSRRPRRYLNITHQCHSTIHLNIPYHNVVVSVEHVIRIKITCSCHRPGHSRRPCRYLPPHNRPPHNKWRPVSRYLPPHKMAHRSSIAAPRSTPATTKKIVRTLMSAAGIGEETDDCFTPSSSSALATASKAVGAGKPLA